MTIQRKIQSGIIWKERPILFSAPMVVGLLGGHKTQTRRAVKFPFPDPQDVRPVADTLKMDAPPGFAAPSVRLSCPYGAADDRLWVRETFGLVPATAYGHSVPHRHDPDDPAQVVIYVAGWERAWEPPKRPSIFTPRWASRLTLEITDVRAERLQDISEEDAADEGAHEWVMGKTGRAYDLASESACRWTKRLDPAAYVCSCRGEFAALWQGINGKRPGCAWTDNPWVWAVSFRKVDTE